MDRRKFWVESKNLGRYGLFALSAAAARALATFARKSDPDVRIVNVKTGESFKWWPELGA